MPRSRCILSTMVMTALPFVSRDTFGPVAPSPAGAGAAAGLSPADDGGAACFFIQKTPAANPAATNMTTRKARFTVSPVWLARLGLAPDRATLRADAAQRPPAHRGLGAIWSVHLPRSVRSWPIQAVP